MFSYSLLFAKPRTLRRDRSAFNISYITLRQAPKKNKRMALKQKRSIYLFKFFSVNKLVNFVDLCLSLFVNMLQPVLLDVPAQKPMTSHVTMTIIILIIGAEVAIFPTEKNASVRSAGFLITTCVNINVS